MKEDVCEDAVGVRCDVRAGSRTSAASASVCAQPLPSLNVLANISPRHYKPALALFRPVPALRSIYLTCKYTFCFDH